MPSVYLYAVSYDLGFAPNPYGGLCTLACCKPAIRSRAQHGDWIVGLTGTKLEPAGRCVFAMAVTGDMTFEQYWENPDYLSRRPKRNGSPMKLVGDNIYHRDAPDMPWLQEDSVHSLENGEQCPLNTAHDTRINRILLSTRFIYFGAAAPLLPEPVRTRLGYVRNPRDYCRYGGAEADALIGWIKHERRGRENRVLADPLNFASTSKRFSASRQRMI